MRKIKVSSVILTILALILFGLACYTYFDIVSLQGEAESLTEALGAGFGALFGVLFIAVETALAALLALISVIVTAKGISRGYSTGCGLFFIFLDLVALVPGVLFWLNAFLNG